MGAVPNAGGDAWGDTGVPGIIFTAKYIYFYIAVVPQTIYQPIPLKNPFVFTTFVDKSSHAK